MDVLEILRSKHVLTRQLCLMGLCINGSYLKLAGNFFHIPTTGPAKSLDGMGSLRRYTHFISIPCIGDCFRRTFLEFKSQVLKDNEFIVETLFQNPNKMHLTLGVLTLPDDESKELAVNTLQHCKDTVINPLLGNSRLKIKMSGVAILNNAPSKARVVYGKVSCPNDDKLLQHLTQSVHRTFIDKGLISRNDKLTLHLTLMNSTFRIRKERINNTRIPRTFDATNILKAFEDFDFGCEEIPSIDISNFTKYGENGYYLPLASVPIP